VLGEGGQNTPFKSAKAFRLRISGELVRSLSPFLERRAEAGPLGRARAPLEVQAVQAMAIAGRIDGADGMRTGMRGEGGGMNNKKPTLISSKAECTPIQIAGQAKELLTEALQEIEKTGCTSLVICWVDRDSTHCRWTESKTSNRMHLIGALYTLLHDLTVGTGGDCE